MSAIALYICLVGAASVVVGLTLQMIGGTAFSSFGGSDTKELAGVAGIRIAAIFGIAVGLIFSSSNAHYTEAKKDLFEEVRLIGTIYTLVARSPDTSDSRSLREKLRQYVQASAMEMDQPEMADQLAISTNETLIEACEQVAREFERQVSTAWFRAELQRLCDSSIDLRGKKRVRILVSNTDVPFWIFFAISFAFLAFLFGVFERRLLNLVFSALFYFAAGTTALLIFWLSNPYHGPNRIASTPFMQLIAKMD